VTRDFVCSAKASNGSSRAPELGEARFAYFKLQREFISVPASSLEISKKTNRLESTNHGRLLLTGTFLAVLIGDGKRLVAKTPP
jgi:hypothetical protein